MSERIEADHQFFHSTLESLQHFFIYGILHEVIGKWYTRKPVVNLENVVLKPIPANNSSSDLHDNEDVSKLWCYCNQPSYGVMFYAITKNEQLNGFTVIA